MTEPKTTSTSPIVLLVEPHIKSLENICKIDSQRLTKSREELHSCRHHLFDNVQQIPNRRCWLPKSPKGSKDTRESLK